MVLPHPEHLDAGASLVPVLHVMVLDVVGWLEQEKA
jgi:hypothetical protein